MVLSTLLNIPNDMIFNVKCSHTSTLTQNSAVTLSRILRHFHSALFPLCLCFQNLRLQNNRNDFSQFLGHPYRPIYSGTRPTISDFINSPFSDLHLATNIPRCCLSYIFLKDFQIIIYNSEHSRFSAAIMDGGEKR